MHVPQSIVSMNEIAELACVPSQIISPRECSPILSIEQDVALGVYRITKNHVMLSEKQMFNMLCNNSMFTGMMPKPISEKGLIKKWSGRQLLSTIIPKNINIDMANSSYDEDKPDKDENFVRIHNGEILGGVIDKTVYQARTKGLVHSIFNEYDQFTAAKFFDNTQQLVCDWLVQSGFSVGISDLIVDDEANVAMKTEIQKMKQQVYDIINDIHTNKFENTSIKNNMDYFEDKVNNILSKATDDAGRIGISKVNDLQNRMMNMIKSKSKGKITNVGQMIACLGQNSDEGKRIPYGFENRTLPHFAKYDDSPESRGFVENSFISGLSPHEFFFHAIGGRGGLIDTAVKSVTGDTKIVILENDYPKYVSIGDWIDQHLDGNIKDIECFEEKNMELLYLKEKTFIPTTDALGNVSWGEVTAITRHDLGNHLYKIKTLAGKTVIVPESKSLLVWNNETKSFAEKLTTDVKIGDYMPVTQKLCDAPISIDYVDMNKYLPKTEYVYGTDFNKAKYAMAETMQQRNRIPSGWWAENNGTTFTLPYVSKARLTRTIKRYNTENIKDGCIYPYHASREHGYIADKFQLTKENGIFVGLYLAEGNSCMTAGRVTISNNDPSVQSFVKTWFEKQGIATWQHSKINKIGGTSSGVDGYSLLLGRFLNDFVGSGARNKYVPDVAFVAPEEFVIGLLNGYFSGDGTVSKNSVECGSASARLTEGISMLCTRIGVFGKVFTTQGKSNNVGTENIAPSHRLAIRAQWASKFADKVELIMKSKNTQLQALKCSEVHRNFPSQNDVVLDAITEIELVDMSKYPKLYDLTVPSTMNFGLANGLHVYDTSDTGYLQRKLVKAMEDCKINYDYTVRNASGSIIQFLYGEDGMDPTKIESQSLPFVKMDYTKLKKTYLLTEDDELKNVLDADIVESFYKNKNWQEKFSQHFQQILTEREYVMKNILAKDQGSSIMYPVSFDRITKNAKAMFNKYDGGVLSDLDPMYVLETIEKLGEDLYVSKNNKGNKFMKMLINAYLSPKKVIFDYRFNKLAFDYVINKVKQRFYDSIAHPSDMVGVVAAQSIGEPATQI
jgi:intein/homing endonuclease